jgi:hypothetical protein
VAGSLSAWVAKCLSLVVLVVVLDDSALVENQDAVHVRDRGQPMRDHHHRPALHQVDEAGNTLTVTLVSESS